eukprot:Tbor_TRINITY_DN3696_c0_g1::TRINITY_DN3696_c0_g1_i1::g.268::m.268
MFFPNTPVTGEAHTGATCATTNSMYLSYHAAKALERNLQPTLWCHTTSVIVLIDNRNTHHYPSRNSCSSTPQSQEEYCSDIETSSVQQESELVNSDILYCIKVHSREEAKRIISERASADARQSSLHCFSLLPLFLVWVKFDHQMYEDIYRVASQRSISNESQYFFPSQSSSLSSASSASSQCTSIREPPIEDVNIRETYEEREGESSSLPPDRLVVPLLLQGRSSCDGMITAAFLAQLRLLFNKVRIIDRYGDTRDHCGPHMTNADISVPGVRRRGITSGHTESHLVNFQNTLSLGLGFVDLAENVNIVNLKLWDTPKENKSEKMEKEA